MTTTEFVTKYMDNLTEKLLEKERALEKANQRIAELEKLLLEERKKGIFQIY